MTRTPHLAHSSVMEPDVARGVASDGSLSAGICGHDASLSLPSASLLKFPVASRLMAFVRVSSHSP